MKPNIPALKSLIATRKTLTLNARVIQLCGFDDMRDFFSDIHFWGHNRDFTYNPTTESFNRFVRLYIKENYLEDSY